MPEGYLVTIFGIAISAFAGWIYKNRDRFYKNKRQ
jgi:hypothetical protein